MAKSRADYRADDLEISLIGSLYKGPWDKKYWSSSRGKDRYPYPVGYQAVRAHNGGSHKMEIREGPKGPMFVITTGDDCSCSGQTPDIAWDNFQKKGVPRNWHGKRLSCKIDGVEFFGFKNPLVQRLLRELVANSKETAESEATRKRSKRRERINTKLTDEATPKKHRPLPDNAGASNSIQGALELTMHLKLVSQEENSHKVAEDGLLLASIDFHDHPGEKAVPAQEESYKVSKSSGVANDSSMDKSFVRSQDAEVGGFNFATETEDKKDDAVVANHSLGIDDVGLCAPDTLDVIQDNAYEYAPTTLGKRIYGMSNPKEGISASQNVVSETLMTEPYPEKELGPPNSNESSESIDDEIAKSMMTLLLPQAIPLLKKTSREKKTTVGSSETIPCNVKSQGGVNETGHCLEFSSPPRVRTENVQVQKETEMHILSTDLAVAPKNLVDTKLVAPDSYDDNPCGGQVDNQNESICQVEETMSKNIFCDKEVDINLKEKHDGAPVYEPGSVSGCVFACKRLSSEVKDISSSLDKISTGAEFHSNGKYPKIKPDCAEAAETSGTNGRGILDPLQVSKQKLNAETQNMSFSQVQPIVYTRKGKSIKTASKQNYDCPLSESIIYRSSGDSTANRSLLGSGAHQIISDGKQHEKDLLSSEVGLGMISPVLHTKTANKNHIEVLNDMVRGLSQNQSLVCSYEEKDTSDFMNPTTPTVEKSEDHCVDKLVGQKNQESPCSLLSQEQGTSMGKNASCANEVEARSDLNSHLNMDLDNELDGCVELVGCYAHPMPVTHLLVTTKGHEVYICVLCALLADGERMMFIYRVEIKEPTRGCPSLVGHASVRFPIPKYNFGGEIAVERSSLQFTPDGQRLVLLHTIKTPYCREGGIDCLCSTCTSSGFEENSVKIVQLNLGYVSVVTKCKTFEDVRCILVCEPNHLIAVGESGRLHLWVMNSTWSAHTEEFVMPANDCTSPCIVELKRIPQSSSLIVGHDGFGKFSIWDISQRIMLSRFSAPATSIYQCIPISMFSWQRKDDFLRNLGIEEHIDVITATTKVRSVEQNSENDSFLPLDGEDTAVWLLVSTVPDTDAEDSYISKDCQNNPVSWWRLALLAKKSVIFGSALDPRAAAIGVSMGQGIMGTCDGLVYMWEPATGAKLRTLHDFKGGGVSCIATDDSKPGVLAVAGGGGQLLVYTRSQKSV